MKCPHPTCKRRFFREKSLRVHMSKQHGPPYQCPHCRKVYMGYPRALLTHMKVRHTHHQPLEEEEEESEPEEHKEVQVNTHELRKNELSLIMEELEIKSDMLFENPKYVYRSLQEHEYDTMGNMVREWHHFLTVHDINAKNVSTITFRHAIEQYIDTKREREEYGSLKNNLYAITKVVTALLPSHPPILSNLQWLESQASKYSVLDEYWSTNQLGITLLDAEALIPYRNQVVNALKKVQQEIHRVIRFRLTHRYNSATEARMRAQCNRFGIQVLRPWLILALQFTNAAVITECYSNVRWTLVKPSKLYEHPAVFWDSEQHVMVRSWPGADGKSTYMSMGTTLSIYMYFYLEYCTRAPISTEPEPLDEPGESKRRRRTKQKPPARKRRSNPGQQISGLTHRQGEHVFVGARSGAIKRDLVAELRRYMEDVLKVTTRPLGTQGNRFMRKMQDISLASAMYLMGHDKNDVRNWALLLNIRQAKSILGDPLWTRWNQVDNIMQLYMSEMNIGDDLVEAERADNLGTRGLSKLFQVPTELQEFLLEEMVTRLHDDAEKVQGILET